MGKLLEKLGLNSETPRLAVIMAVLFALILLGFDAPALIIIGLLFVYYQNPMLISKIKDFFTNIKLFK